KNIFYEKSITEQEYAALLQTQAKHDFQYGYTVFGPHRDDFNFQIDSYPLAHYASQGEGRIFIYTLKLAAFQYMKKINSEYPLLLVDDIFSDLDSERISCIFNYIRTLPQFILACANISAINRHLAGFHIYVIKEGTIKHAADA
ncbi:MAG TPA: hypothetical protein DC049_00930, partial [Spirochaetia bacterium]|nr:hypothetical protein [Spirochaetia bacterium]